MEAEQSHSLQATDPRKPVVQFSLSPKAWEAGQMMIQIPSKDRRRGDEVSQQLGEKQQILPSSSCCSMQALSTVECQLISGNTIRDTLRFRF